jgi:hypothetical protein
LELIIVNVFKNAILLVNGKIIHLILIINAAIVILHV